MLLLIGDVLDVEEVERSNRDKSKSWTETVLHVLVGRRVERVRVARPFKERGGLPVKSERVALEVGIDTWVSGDSARFAYTAWALNTDVDVSAAKVAA